MSKKVLGEKVVYMRGNSPVGDFLIGCTEHAIVSLYFDTPIHEKRIVRQNSIGLEALRQLEKYFTGKLFNFDLPLAPGGTEFQQQVWDALYKIPYGETRSYKQMAESIGKPKAYRAVGGANNRNPIPIIIPCHRVIGADASLVGYGGGLDKKVWLLQHEKEHKK